MYRTMCVLFGIAALMLSAGNAAAVELEYGWQRPHRVLPPDVKAPDDPQYRKECGACHFPYPPGFLPARSWRAVMGKLSDHFGDDAEMDSQTATQILSYLERNAADHSSEIDSVRLMQRMPPDATPLRLTDTYYLRLRHRNVLRRFIRNNPRVKGFGDCGACHIRGEQGYFNEQLISIPGFSR